MRTWFVLAVAAVSLAGCTVDGPMPRADEFHLTVDSTPPTQQEVATITGTVSTPATVAITLLGNLYGGETVAGAWSIRVELAYGQNEAMVTADDGRESIQRDLVVLRMAPGAMAVSFDDAVPPRQDRADDILVDIDHFSSSARYETCDFEHPGFYTVMDAMVEWEAQSDVAITYSECSGNGYFVNDIDGHDRADFWCYTRNGEAAQLGISLEPFAAGDQVLWGGCSGIL